MELKSKMGLRIGSQLSSFGLASIPAISGCAGITDRLRWSDRVSLVKGLPPLGLMNSKSKFHFKGDFYGIEIENGPLDWISTLFVWFGKNSSYIGLCRHHGQTETIWSSVLGQRYTSKAPVLRPCRLAAHIISWFSISPEPGNGSPFSIHLGSLEELLPLSRLIPMLVYTLCHTNHFRFRRLP